MGPRPPDLISMPAVGISNNAMPDILNNNNNIYIYILRSPVAHAPWHVDSHLRGMILDT